MSDFANKKICFSVATKFLWIFVLSNQQILCFIVFIAELKNRKVHVLLSIKNAKIKAFSIFFLLLLLLSSLSVWYLSDRQKISWVNTYFSNMLLLSVFREFLFVKNLLFSISTWTVKRFTRHTCSLHFLNEIEPTIFTVFSQHCFAISWGSNLRFLNIAIKEHLKLFGMVCLWYKISKAYFWYNDKYKIGNSNNAEQYVWIQILENSTEINGKNIVSTQALAKIVSIKISCGWMLWNMLIMLIDFGMFNSRIPLSHFYNKMKHVIGLFLIHVGDHKTWRGEKSNNKMQIIRSVAQQNWLRISEEGYL